MIMRHLRVNASDRQFVACDGCRFECISLKVQELHQKCLGVVVYPGVWAVDHRSRSAVQHCRHVKNANRFTALMPHRTCLYILLIQQYAILW